MRHTYLIVEKMKLCYYQKLNYGAHDTTNEHRPLMYFCSSVKKTFNVCPEETKFSLFEHWLLKNVYLSGVGGEKATSKREQRRFTCFAEQKWFHVINPLM